MNRLRHLSLLAAALLIVVIFCLSASTKSIAQNSQTGQISRILWNSDGSLIASANWDGEIAVINSESGSVLYSWIAHTGPVTDIAWSPDDTRLASIGIDQTLKIWNAATGQLLTTSTMTNGEYASSLVWSRDGSHVITCSGEASPNFLVWDATTGSLQQEFHAGTTVQMVWSPDGQYLALANPTGGIELRNGTTLQFVQFLSSGEPGGLGYDVYSLAWNSNGTQIASGSLNGTIRIWNTATGAIERTFDANEASELGFSTSAVSAVAFSADNSKIMGISANGTLRHWNLSNAQLLGTTQLNNAAYAAAFSPDGSKLAYASDPGTIQVVSVPVPTLTPASPPQDYRIVFRSDIDLNSASMIVNSDGTDPQFLPFNNGENYDAACSLDGNFLAYLTPGGIEIRDAQFNLVDSIPGSQLSGLPRLAGLSIAIGGNKIAYVKADANGYQNIYISNPDGSNITQVTTGSSFNTNPAISPDGMKILFESNRHTTLPNKREIFVVNVDGTNLTQLTNTGGVNVSPNWSPDGSRIVFTSDRLDGIGLNIYVMNVDGTNVTALTALPSGNYQPTWSPNGNEIAYVSTQDTGRGYNDIYVMNADGSSVRRITNDGYHKEIPCWLQAASQPASTPTPILTPTPTPTPIGSDQKEAGAN